MTTEVTVKEVDPNDEEELISEEWENAICKITDFKERLSALMEEKEVLSEQRSTISKRIFDLQAEIRLLEAKILLEFEHVVRVNYSAPQMVIIAEGQMNKEH